MIFAVFSIGIDSGRQRGYEAAVDLPAYGVGAESVGHRGYDDRPKSRYEEIVHHLFRRFSPKRFHDFDSVRRELLLPVFAHIVQENIPEDETGHALRLEMLHGPGHGDVVILHIAFGRQVYDIKRNADAFGLHLQ